MSYMKRVILSIFIATILAMQLGGVIYAEESESEQTIPVYYRGYEVTTFDAKVKDNDGKDWGWVTFKVSSTGKKNNGQIEISFEAMDKDGNWVEINREGEKPKVNSGELNRVKIIINDICFYNEGNTKVKINLSMHFDNNNTPEKTFERTSTKEVAFERKIENPVHKFNCDDTACCDCSTALAKGIQELIIANAYVIPHWSGGNFNDRMRHAIYDNIINGSQYDFELSKYELSLLFDKYLDETAASTTTINNMYYKKYNEEGTSYTWQQKNVPWTKKNALDAFQNAYLQKSESAGDHNGRVEAANVYNTYIKTYIDFKKDPVTMNDLAEILDTLGIKGMKGRSLDEMKEEIGHTHDPYKSGICEECNCSHLCSVKMRGAIQSVVHKIASGESQVAGYDYYINAKISSSDEALNNIMSNQIRIGVKNIGTETSPYYVVGECVCRLGATLVETPSSVSSELLNGINCIQPEGITNIITDFKFDKPVENLVAEIDMTDLVDDVIEVDGVNKQINDYNIPNASVILKKKGTVDAKLATDRYTIDKSDSKKIKITFASDFVTEASETYEIAIYLPTDMKEGIQYSYKGTESKDSATNKGNSYRAKRLDDSTKNKINVAVKYDGRVKVADAKDVVVDGVTYHYDAIYEELPAEAKNHDVKLSYIEIANIN